MNTKTIQITLTEKDYHIIANEARNRLLKPTQFIKYCVASFLNKSLQTRVFTEDTNIYDKSGTTLVLRSDDKQNGYLKELVDAILQERGIIECNLKQKLKKS